MKKVLSLILIVLLFQNIFLYSIAAQEQNSESDGEFLFTREGNFIVIKGLVKGDNRYSLVGDETGVQRELSVSTLHVPAAIDGAHVVLEKEAFRGRNGFRKIVFEQGVTQIPEGLCRDMPNLEEVVILSNVVEIGDYAFKDCKKLKTVKLTYATKIGKEAFAWCENLSNIEFIEAEDIEKSAFDGTSVTLSDESELQSDENNKTLQTEDIKSKAEFISRFDDHTIAFYENTIWAWGGEYGEVPVMLLENVKKLEVLNASSGEYSYYAICEDNSLYVWGAHGFYANMMPGSKPSKYTYVGGMLGMACNTNVAPLYYGPPGSIDYSKYSEKTPDQTTPVKLLDGVKKVIAGGGKVVALGINGEVYIWGEYSGAHNNGEYAPKLINSNADELYITGTSPAFNTGLIGIREKDGSLAIYSGDRLKVRVNDVVKTYVVMQQYFPSFFVLTKDGKLWKADSSDKNVVTENVTGFEQIEGIVYVRTADGSVYESGMLTSNLQLTDKEIEFESASQSIGIVVDGEKLAFDTEPYIKSDRTLVPMRAIFEALGAEVSWDNETRTAIGVKGGVEVKITIGENVLYKNGEAIELDYAAEITNDRTMVPVRAISEAFGCTVTWNNEMKTVEVTK